MTLDLVVSREEVAALGGVGAILYLFTAMSAVGFAILSGAFPMYRIMKQWLRGHEISMGNICLISSWAVFALFLAFILSFFFFQRAVKRLQV